MIDLKFNFVAAQNFLCFGTEGVEVDLTEYGNIILIRGENMDVFEEEEKVSSNGVGKSSIPEAIVYTLYGKTIKQPNKLSHNNVINNKVGKKLRTEVRWDNFRVVRSRKPDSLRIWESPDGDWSQIDDEEWANQHEISLGGIPATQKLIEEKVGLNYQTFVNVAVFTDNNSGSFLECDTPTKRQIVENLLSLDKYRQYSETAKKTRNEFKENIKSISSEYDRLISDEKSCNSRLIQAKNEKASWKEGKEKEIVKLENFIEESKLKLAETDLGDAINEYRNAQEEIATIDKSIKDKDLTLAKVKTLLDKANEKLNSESSLKNDLFNKINSLSSSIRSLQQEVSKNENTINNYESKKDTKCPTCLGVVKEENYISLVDSCKEVISSKTLEINDLSNQKSDEETSFKQQESAILKINESIKTGQNHYKKTSEEIDGLRSRRSVLEKIEKPEGDVQTAVLTSKIDESKKQISLINEEIKGESPYESIIKRCEEELASKKKECSSKKKDLEDAEKELPYYEFWVKAFGDSGIRKIVVDGIVPALNSRISHWLQFLIDGKISLSFNNKFEETIDRNPKDGDPFVYYAMSGGERRRLNLAVSQAFAHVMMLNSGASPSLVFLDEVTTNIDPIGVQGVYNMIVELSNHKQVFVTTHDHDLLHMLSGCKSINLKKVNGFTTLCND